MTGAGDDALGAGTVGSGGGPAADRRERTGALIDAYAASVAPLVGPADEDPEDGGVPEVMRVGEPDDQGQVAWRPVPSTVTDEELDAFEADLCLGRGLPPDYRAYLRARCHLFDQVVAAATGSPVLLPAIGPDDPLGPARATVAAWAPLVGAGYLAVGGWGGGIGPLCLDLGSPERAPVVWFDHEALLDLGPDDAADRATVEPLAKPCAEGWAAFLADVFVPFPRD